VSGDIFVHGLSNLSLQCRYRATAWTELKDDCAELRCGRSLLGEASRVSIIIHCWWMELRRTRRAQWWANVN